MTTRRTLIGSTTAVAYVATIPAANLAVQHFGNIPVGFGYAAPAGVYAVGIALVLRDAARELLGRAAVIKAIAAGVVLSLGLSTPALALASAVAFAGSEVLDFFVYEKLREHGKTGAMVASNAAGLVVDSLVFLAIAFGSLDYLPGQIIGKAWMTVLAVLALPFARRGLERVVSA